MRKSVCMARHHDMEIDCMTGIIENMFRSCGSWACIQAQAERQLPLEAAKPLV